MADAAPPADELRQLQEQLAKLSVDDFLVSAASTIATLAHGKLEATDLPQAKQAIDALAALVPHLSDDPGRELRAVLASLQVAYSQAATG